MNSVCSVKLTSYHPSIDSLSTVSPPQQPYNTNQPNEDQLNLVVWSEWSHWSSCVDKNGVCDPARLHSRLRKCMLQHTGEKVESSQCKQRFNQQDQELEVAECSQSCANQQVFDQQHNQLRYPANPNEAAPSVISSPTGSILTGEPTTDGAGSGYPLLHPIKPKQGSPQAAASTAPSPTTQEPSPELPAPSTTDRSSSNQPPSEPAPTTPFVDQQQQLSCTNCTTDEICLLLMSQKVPFCAKIKERADESGCGGWCKAQNQLCQPVGQNAFKCIHDSECLPGEWRCHDSLCIPLINRCDGHNNCFDNSDERNCPIRN